MKSNKINKMKTFFLLAIFIAVITPCLAQSVDEKNYKLDSIIIKKQDLKAFNIEDFIEKKVFSNMKYLTVEETETKKIRGMVSYMENKVKLSDGTIHTFMDNYYKKGYKVQKMPVYSFMWEKDKSGNKTYFYYIQKFDYQF